MASCIALSFHAFFAIYSAQLHELKGDMRGHYSISVNGNWRLTFRFEGEDVILLDYQDYH